MKKRISIILFILFTSILVFAQSDDDLFGSDDDFFSDDGIEIIENVSAKSDLSKGTIFETGSIKIGGNFKTSLETTTIVYEDTPEDEQPKTFGDHIKETTLKPTLSAFLTVDARPTDILRMYTKFGLAYPFDVKGTYSANSKMIFADTATKKYVINTQVTGSITDWFKLKEMFTDFSVADTAFFRFGLHTVTWGTGLFFSPVSDIINASSINPEDTEEQVDGVLNLRTQITFPNTQNCLWLYVIPSTDFNNVNSAESYARKTAFAAKGDIVIGGWEFGLGGYYKFENAPKGVFTASGSLKKLSLFGEFVYQYGSKTQWNKNTDWTEKDSIFQATAGFSYLFKDPQIMIAGQYYFDSNGQDFDLTKLQSTGLSYGHNIAAMISFGKIFGTTDWSATLLGIVNINDGQVSKSLKDTLALINMDYPELVTIISGTLSYSPFKNCKLGCGPYITIVGKETKPIVAVKLSATLGGGKF